MAWLNLAGWRPEAPDPPAPPPRPRPAPPPPPPAATSPARPAPPSGPAARPAGAVAANRPAARAETAASAPSQPQAAGQGASVLVVPDWSDGRQGGSQQQGGAAPAGSTGGDPCDCGTLLDLLPTDGDSGIFEILLPNGGKLGVMVDVGRTAASFLLSPGGPQLRDWLRRKQMELQLGLARRMHRTVRLAVL